MKSTLEQLTSASDERVMTSQHAEIATYFAPAERKTGASLDEDIDKATTNAFISGLMTIANGLFAVLNDKRQVIAINDSFIKLLGIEDTGQVLGLRPGECVNCIHSCEMPGGCGTSEYCSTCGAVVSIMTTIETRQPHERTCALTVSKDGKNADLYFSVRSCPLEVDGSLYVLLFLQDISMQQHRACLERTFFHDINNILCALVGKSELLTLQKNPSEEKLRELHHIVLRVSQEIAIQNSLQKSLDVSYKPLYAEVSVNRILSEIDQVFHDHPLTINHKLEVNHAPYDINLTTDFHLTSRILINMVTNALEASPEGSKVIVATVPNQDSITFTVWNAGIIPEDVARRIFQRNFSTKSNMGRGFGTYSMKLFGEQVLGGSVMFDSAPDSGTTFRFTLNM